MILLTARAIRKHFGPEPVLDGVTFDVRRGQRIALVGPNGTGKTTLLKILVGREDQDAGDVELHSSSRIGYLEQQPDFDTSNTVWEEARSALGELLELASAAERLGEAISSEDDVQQRERLERRFDHLQHELERRDAYHLNHKIERVLAGLGFQEPQYKQPVRQLSGGQQNRLLLARLLLQDADLLLLDEPSNHLDLDATQWLEDFLIETKQSLIVVSHDRYFLDKVTNQTFELFQGTVDSYNGNFSAYVRQKAERLEVQKRTHERQQTEIAKMEDFVRRHSYGQKHAQAEDRRKKLERIERVAAPRDITAPPMSFPPAPRSGDIVLRAEGLSKSFELPLFQDLTFDILRGEKWGILGPNGSGKTTLLRCLLHLIDPDAGRVILGTGVKAGYFDQLLHCLDSGQAVVDSVRPSHKEFIEQQRRDLLARFGVTGDMVFQRVEQLSGGERNRAALAYLSALDANLLILDEPTNHLDLWARESLERALRKFDGTVVFVSHDRYFVNQVADHLLVVEPDRFRVIEGNYDTYRHLVQQGLAKEASNAGSQPAADNDGGRARARRDRPARRKRKFAYRKVKDLESDIAECEATIEQLHQDLTSPDVLRDGEKVKSAKADLEQRELKLSQLLEHWEEASELNNE